MNEDKEQGKPAGETEAATASGKRPARRALKWIAGAIAGVVILIVAVSAAAYALLDEALLKKELSAALGREVTFSKIAPGLLRISIDDLSVGELAGFESDPLIVARRLDLKYSLLSVLKGKLVINRVILEDAQLGLEQKGESSNFADLTKKDKDGSLLEIRALELKDLDLVLRLDSRVIEVKKLSGEVTELASIPNNFDVEGFIHDAGFTAKGWVNAESYTGEVAVSVVKLPIDRLGVAIDTVDLKGLSLSLSGNLGFSPDTFTWKGDADIPGLAALTADVAGPVANPLATKGTVTATIQVEGLDRVKPAREYLAKYKPKGGVRVTIPLTGDITALPSSLSGEFLGLSALPPEIGKPLEAIKGKFRVSPSEAFLDNVSFVVAGTPITVSGRVGLEKMTLDLSVKTGQAEVANLLGLLPKSPLPPGVSVTGPLALDVKVAGTVEAPLLSGRIVLAGFNAKTSNPPATISDIRGALVLNGDIVKLEGIRAKVNTASLAIEGTVNMKSLDADLHIEAPHVDVGAMLALAPKGSVPEGVGIAGPASVNAQISSRKDALDMKGTVILEGMKVSVAPPAAKQSATFEDLRGTVKLAGKNIELEKVTARHGTSAFGISGTYNTEAGAMNLALAGKSVDVGALAALAPTSPLPPGISLGGRASLDLKVKGKAELPDVAGWIQMEGMSLGLAEPKTDLEDLRGRLDLAGDDVKLTDVTAKMKSMAVQVSGTYDRKSEGLNLKVKADNIVLAELPADLGTQTLDVKGAAAFDGAVTGKASAPLVKGDLRSQKLELFGVEVSDVLASFTFDSPSVDVAHLRAGILGGEVSGAAGMNILSPVRPFKLRLEGTGMDFAEAIAIGTKMTGSSFTSLTGGKISGNIDIAAANFDDKSSFNGTGKAEAKDVDLSSVKLLSALSQALAAGQLKSLSGISGALSKADMKRYEDVKGSFRIEKGRLNIAETIRLKPFGDYTIGFRGGVGLDGSIDGLVADVDLPKSWFGSDGARIVQLLTGAKSSGDKVSMPFSFSGSFSSPKPAPSFKLDPKALLPGVLDLFGKKNQDSPAPATETPAAGGEEAATGAEAAPAGTATTDTVAAPPPKKTKEEEIMGIIGGLFGK